MNDTKKNNSIIQKSAIAAIATPVGEGGIAVIRVSGKDAISLVNKAFQEETLLL